MLVTWNRNRSKPIGFCPAAAMRGVAALKSSTEVHVGCATSKDRTIASRSNSAGCLPVRGLYFLWSTSVTREGPLAPSVHQPSTVGTGEAAAVAIPNSFDQSPEGSSCVVATCIGAIVVESTVSRSLSDSGVRVTSRNASKFHQSMGRSSDDLRSTTSSADCTSSSAPDTPARADCTPLLLDTPTCVDCTSVSSATSTLVDCTPFVTGGSAVGHLDRNRVLYHHLVTRWYLSASGPHFALNFPHTTAAL